MMDVLLDGSPLTRAPNLAHAVAQACSRAEASGRIIVEAILDGVPVNPESFGAGAPSLAGRRLEFVSAAPGELARTALESAAATLDELKSRHRTTAESIRDGHLEPAMAELSHVLATWDQVKAALERSAALLGVGPGSTGEVGGAGQAGGEWARISPVLASLAGRLAEIKRSLVSRDWAGLADVLEYDMDQQAVDFADVLRGFARSSATR